MTFKIENVIFYYFCEIMKEKTNEKIDCNRNKTI